MAYFGQGDMKKALSDIDNAIKYFPRKEKDSVILWIGSQFLGIYLHHGFHQIIVFRRMKSKRRREKTK